MNSSLPALARTILLEPDPAAKVTLSHEAAAAWRNGMLSPTTAGSIRMPAVPARPSHPRLLEPRHMPRRRAGCLRGRVATLHAITHIELNAIDLAWDLIGRFGASYNWPMAFFDDWVRIADEESRHFTMLEARLNTLGASYGDLPAHDGLWQTASETAGDPLARLAVVPMVLEARGLDITPVIVARLRRAGDEESADLLEIILEEEITHVAAGQRWFAHLCGKRGLSEGDTWAALVAKHYRTGLKPPFNEAARHAAGMTPELYGA